MNTNELSDAQRTQFVRNGFIAMRGLFSADEIDDIRSTFMETAKDGPVSGLSDVPKAREGAPTASSDPLSFYPRMLRTPHPDPLVSVGNQESPVFTGLFVDISKFLLH